jgi:hypothetical protein
MKSTMKINIVPSNKLALISAVFCAAMLAFSHNASANRIVAGINAPLTNLTFSDTHVVGTIRPAAPASPGDVAPYINFMIGLATGHSGTFHNPPHTQTVTRSTNLFASLPNALVPGAVSGTGTSINLGAGGVFSYLFAKYDGQNDISQVWYVGNLSGIITIPATGGGFDLSGWTLFGPGGRVPDGGITVMLLGVALGALGIAHRFMS